MKKKQIDILMIEDNLADLRLISLMLEESTDLVFKVHHANRLEEALKMLETKRFDVILTDLGLPDSFGLDGLKTIKGRAGNLPVIVLTGLESEETGIEALRQHASDYLVKGQLTFNNLIRSIRYALARHEVEQELLNERRNLQTIFNTVNIGMFLIDEEGVVQRANHVIGRWIGKRLGKSPNVQIGNVLDCIQARKYPAGCGHTPHCRDCSIRRTFETVLRTGKSLHDVEAEAALAMDGQHALLHFSISVDPVVMSGKRHVVLAMNNITERKQAEEALRESEARMRTLGTATFEGIVVSENGLILEANEQAAQMFGYQLPEVIGTAITGFLKSEDQHVAKEIILKEEESTAEYACLRRDGSEFVIEVRGRMASWKGRRVRITAIRDVTEHKRIERALRWAEKRGAILSKSAAELLASDDPQKTVDAICQRTMEFLDCQVFLNFLSIPGEERLRLNAYAGISEENAKKMEWLEYGVSVCGCAARDGKRIMVEDILRTQDPRTDFIRGYGIQAYGCYPLAASEEVLGTISFGTNQRDRFSEDEIAMMQATADIVAVAIQRKYAEETLKMERSNLETLLETIPVGVALVDEKGGNVKSNKMFGEIWGNPQPEIKNIYDYKKYKSWWEDTGKVILPGEWASDRAIQSGQPVLDQVMRIERFDGTSAFISHSAAPLFNLEGKISGSVVAAIDITKRKRVEEEILKLNRILKAMSSSSQAMARIADEKDYLNEVCRIIVEECGYAMVWLGYIGLDENKMVRSAAYGGAGKSYIEKLDITWANTERGCGPTGTAIRTGKPQVCQDMKIDPNFELWREMALEHGYRSSLVLPLNGDDGIIGALNIYAKEPNAFSAEEINLLTGLANDLVYGVIAIRLRMQRKEAEKILRRDKETFEKLVHERTKELLDIQIKLAQSKRLSDIGTLAATVAHELRTPLGVIRIGAYNMKRKSSDPGLLKHIDHIEAKVVEADKIINNLLLYSRIKTPCLENVFLYDLLNECVREAKESLKERPIRISTQFTCLQGESMRLDPFQMKEVFHNILTNAVDALAGHKKGEIKIHAARRESQGEIAIAFGDNGAGIHKSDLKKIHEPFFTTKSKGTGLGLTVCFQIIENHHGRIEVVSQQGRGAVFTVFLPIQEAVGA